LSHSKKNKSAQLGKCNLEESPIWKKIRQSHTSEIKPTCDLLVTIVCSGLYFFIQIKPCSNSSEMTFFSATFSTLQGRVWGSRVQERTCVPLSSSHLIWATDMTYPAVVMLLVRGNSLPCALASLVNDLRNKTNIATDWSNISAVLGWKEAAADDKKGKEARKREKCNFGGRSMKILTALFAQAKQQ